MSQRPNLPNMPETEPLLIPDNGFNPDDTQPNRAVPPSAYQTPDKGSGTPGCGMTALIGILIAVFAIVIVLLAGAAGWTSGAREASVNATATHGAAIREQLDRIPMDVNSGNTVLLDTRLRYLITQTPGVPGVAEIAQTATALFLGQMSTATPSPTSTLEATPLPESTEPDSPEVTEVVATLTLAPGGGYDLAALLSDAESSIATTQWEDAIATLDAIMAIDPAFETTTVRGLMGDALYSYAMQLYASDQPAAANIIVGQAEELDLMREGMEYERYMAELYLNARSGSGLGNPAAARDLQTILGAGAGGRYYTAAIQLLYDNYVRQGDNWVGQGEYCPAAPLYQQAVNLLPSGIATSKLSTANAFCAQATPIGAIGGATPLPGFAPIGQVPGQ